MTARVALFLLALIASACQVDTSNGGIGTSPGYDDVQDPVVPKSSPLEALPTCGIWHDATAEAADVRALAGEPPEVLVFAGLHATCSDALAFAAWRWPGASAVRVAVQGWRAREAP